LAKEIKSLEAFKTKAGELTERPGRRARQGDLGLIVRAYYPEIFDLAIKTPVGEIGGPVVTSRKYSVFYVADKTSPELKDFLGVKRTILDKLNREQRNRAIEAWIDERLKQSTVEVVDDALWSTVDLDKYAVSDTLEG